MPKTVIITGGAGFIGSHIVDALVGRGFHVTVIDNLSTGRLENLRQYAGANGRSPRRSAVRFLRIDIRSPRLSDLFGRIQPIYVFHLAAQLDVRTSLKDPLFDADVNILGSLNVIQASVAVGVKKFIFTSSGGAVYGDPVIKETSPQVPSLLRRGGGGFLKPNENSHERPISPYGVAKLTIDKYLHQFHYVHSLPYVSLRFSNVYGPRQNPEGEAGVVAIFAGRLVQGKTCFINGSGRQTRDFVYVGDVVNAALAAMQSPYVGPVNIATGVETSVNDVYKILARLIGSHLKPKHRPAIKGEQIRSVLDWGLARKVLRWKPVVGLEEGLRRTVQWHYENAKNSKVKNQNSKLQVKTFKF